MTTLLFTALLVAGQPQPTPAPADPAAPVTTAEPAASPVSEPAPVEPAPTPVEPAPTAEPAPTTVVMTDPFAAPGAPPSAEPVPIEAPRRTLPSKGQFLFAWDMSQPVGSSHDFVPDYSAIGVSMGFEYRVIPMLAVGALGGFTYTDNVTRTTRTFENGAITATELRSIETVPLMATATLHIPTGRDGPRGRGIAEPFVGLGIGTYYTYREADFGWFYANEDGWHFGLMPTVGVQIDTPGPQVILGSRFNWAAKTKDSAEELFFTFNLGLGFFAF